jgi:hypothetical protein
MAEVFREAGLEAVPGFGKGLALLGDGEIDILF